MRTGFTCYFYCFYFILIFSLGYVPHCDLMQFIAMATSGAYLAKAPPVSDIYLFSFTLQKYHCEI